MRAGSGAYRKFWRTSPAFERTSEDWSVWVGERQPARKEFGRYTFATHGWVVPIEGISALVPECWLERGLGTEEDTTPRAPDPDIITAHGARTENPSTVQQQLRQLVYRVHHAAHATALNQLPEKTKSDKPLFCRRTRDEGIGQTPPQESLRGRSCPPAFGHGQRTPCKSPPHLSSWDWADE